MFLERSVVEKLDFGQLKDFNSILKVSKRVLALKTLVFLSSAAGSSVIIAEEFTIITFK